MPLFSLLYDLLEHQLLECYHFAAITYRYHMPKVTFIKGNDKVTAEGTTEETLLDIANRTEGVEIMSACGGNGMCITCMCDVKGDTKTLSELTEAEELMGFTEGSTQRLGCQAKLVSDAEVEITM